MARKSKYQETTTERPSCKVWSVAVYLRLSRDDGDKPESESISSQRDLLTDFIGRNNDLEIYDIYADDGYTGTNFVEVR